jgi:glycosyltransferase involved in cell wall biosynthesis
MLANLAIGLLGRPDFEPVVLIPDPTGGPLAAFCDAHRVSWREIPSPRWYIFEETRNAPDFVRSILSNSRVVGETLRDISADLVIVNTLTTFEGVAAAVDLGLPFVSWVHGILDPALLGKSEAIAPVLENLTLDLAERVVTCSNWTADHFKTRCDPDKVIAVHNWTAVPNTRPQSKPGDRLVCLSTMDEHKGIHVLIEAIALLSERGRRIGVDIFAAGGSEQRLRGMARERGVEDLIAFRGRTMHVERAYRESLAVAVPSFFEPFGMVAIESMAQGRPVIASRVGGLREIISHGETGLLFRPGDAAGMAEQILALQDARTWERLAKNGYERARTAFSGEKSISAFAEILTQAISRFKGRERATLRTFDLLRVLAAAAPAQAAIEARGREQAERLSYIAQLEAGNAELVSLLEQIKVEREADYERIRRDHAEQLAYIAHLEGANTELLSLFEQVKSARDTAVERLERQDAERLAYVAQLEAANAELERAADKERAQRDEAERLAYIGQLEADRAELHSVVHKMFEAEGQLRSYVSKLESDNAELASTWTREEAARRAYISKLEADNTELSAELARLLGANLRQAG